MARAPVHPDAPAEAQLERLRFLYEVARLATTARTWDELLETVVDGTRDALHAAVSSLYLLDRDGQQLTLAATNGLDRYQIGRARVPFGDGVTGRVAASRQPAIIRDVAADPHFLWVRGLDQRRFVASMLSVPLSWQEKVVGVLNVQTEQPRDFSAEDAAHLSAIADLLAGIVEKGRLQKEAEAQLESLRAIDEARSELIALVTHELRTPLAVVRAYADLLAEEPSLEGRASRDVQRRAARSAWHVAAIEQIERLDRLVDSILASVSHAAATPAEVVTVDAEGLVAEVVEGLAPILHRHRVVAEGARLHVLADPSRLRQILEHLLENAVKYAPPGSRISVSWSLHEGAVRIAVSDEGPGIPPEWRERIFEPYARRDTHTARGSGIGLYAARRLGRSMGARLWCEPVEPTGARFVLALPAAVAVSMVVERRLPPPRPLRILVVDDDPAMIGAITALVGTAGHQVLTAYDGLTAVRRFREEWPDLVLLDLAMPGPDGFSVASQIRSAGSAPIVVVSGESAEEAKVRALELGADDYLVKPFGKNELLARIAAVMRRVERDPTGAPAAGGGPLTTGRLTIDPGRHEARVGGTVLDLTPTEYRLLEVLVAAAGNVVPHLRLVRAGWPAETDPDLLWLKPHVTRLRSKLQLAGGPTLVAVRSVGYRLEA